MKRTIVRYRAFKSPTEKGEWRNTETEAIEDAVKLGYALYHRVELGSPVRIKVCKI